MDHVAHPGEWSIQDLLVQEQQRRQRLVLRRRAHLRLRRQVREVRPDLGLGHRVRVSLPVKEDEAADSPHVGLLRPGAVVTGS